MKLNSETQLVEAAQNGHLESFGALYERYHSSMTALAYSMLANRDLAEDAAQEVFAIACRDIGSLKNKERFAAWLAGICRNVSRQMLIEPTRAEELLRTMNLLLLNVTILRTAGRRFVWLYGAFESQRESLLLCVTLTDSHRDKYRKF